MELVVSDVIRLRGAIAAVFGGASWQRCRTHFMTNLLWVEGGHHGHHETEVQTG